MNPNGTFKSQQAPCGRLVDGEHYEDHDDECVMTRQTVYACGCQTVQHEYHDGSVNRRVIRHDGKLLAEERASGV